VNLATVAIVLLINRSVVPHEFHDHMALDMLHGTSSSTVASVTQTGDFAPTMVFSRHRDGMRGRESFFLLLVVQVMTTTPSMLSMHCSCCWSSSFSNCCCRSIGGSSHCRTGRQRGFRLPELSVSLCQRDRCCWAALYRGDFLYGWTAGRSECSVLLKVAESERDRRRALSETICSDSQSQISWRRDSSKVMATKQVSIVGLEREERYRERFAFATPVHDSSWQDESRVK